MALVVLVLMGVSGGGMAVDWLVPYVVISRAILPPEYFKYS